MLCLVLGKLRKIAKELKSRKLKENNKFKTRKLCSYGISNKLKINKFYKRLKIIRKGKKTHL